MAKWPPISDIIFNPYIIAAIISELYDCISSIMTLEYLSVAANISVPNALYTNLNI